MLLHERKIISGKSRLAFYSLGINNNKYVKECKVYIIKSVQGVLTQDKGTKSRCKHDRYKTVAGSLQMLPCPFILRMASTLEGSGYRPLLFTMWPIN